MKPKQAFAAFRRWRERTELDGDVDAQARICQRHLDCVEMNLPWTPKQTIAPALAELHKLERMLAFPTI